MRHETDSIDSCRYCVSGLSPYSGFRRSAGLAPWRRLGSWHWFWPRRRRASCGCLWSLRLLWIWALWIRLWTSLLWLRPSLLRRTVCVLRRAPLLPPLSSLLSALVKELFQLNENPAKLEEFSPGADDGLWLKLKTSTAALLQKTSQHVDMGAKHRSRVL